MGRQETKMVRPWVTVRHDAAGEHADDKQDEEPDDQAVQALGAGDDLQDQALGEVLRRLAEQARGSLAGDAGAPGGAYTAKSHRQRRT